MRAHNNDPHNNLNETQTERTDAGDDNLSIVVPTYNAQSLAVKTIDRLLKTDADRVIVCDDNSTDDTVKLLEERFGGDIDIIAGEENVGAAGNRNRSLGLIDDGNILFVDVDTELIYDESLKNLISRKLGDCTVGAVGFGILNKSGEPMGWNFGDLMNPILEAEARVFERLYKEGKITLEKYVESAPGWAASNCEVALSGTTEVGWVAEGCFATKADVLKSIGGFPEDVRYHEAHFIGQRYKRAQKKILFDPTYVVRHLEHDVRGPSRDEERDAARAQYYGEFWGMSEFAVEKLFEHERNG